MLTGGSEGDGRKNLTFWSRGCTLVDGKLGLLMTNSGMCGGSKEATKRPNRRVKAAGSGQEAQEQEYDLVMLTLIVILLMTDPRGR
jgi:hypothetical protein